MKITRFPSRYVIEDINEDLVDKCSRMLSTWDKVTFSYTNQIYKYDEESNTMIIPGSMSMYKLNQLGITEDIIIDKRQEKLIRTRNMTSIKLVSEPRNDLQKAAINFLKGNGYSKGSTQNLLSLKTGEGKTYCAINYCVSTKIVPLIFVDQDSLAQQWKSSIIKFTNCTEDNIYIISGQRSITKLMKMNKKDINNYKFFITIHRTMQSYITENDANEFLNKTGIGVKIFDEAHLEMLSMFQADESMDIPSIYLTATPDRSDKSESIMYKNAMREAKLFSSEKGIFKQDKYHNILLAKIDSKPNLKDSSKFISKYGFSLNAYSSYMERKDKWEFFYDKITRLVRFANKKANRKMAIIVHLLSTVEKIVEQVGKDYPDLKIARFDGTLTKEEKEEALKADIIVTTDASFSKGIDVKGLEVVINLVPVSSKPKIEQMLGRLRLIEGQEVWFFDVIDIGVPNIGKILKEKQVVYTKKAKNIKDTILK